MNARDRQDRDDRRDSTNGPDRGSPGNAPTADGDRDRPVSTAHPASIHREPSGSRGRHTSVKPTSHPGMNGQSSQDGIQIDRSRAEKLARLEKEYGPTQVKRWANEENMPVEVMGNTREMRAFRERQQRPESDPRADVLAQGLPMPPGARNASNSRDDDTASTEADDRGPTDDESENERDGERETPKWGWSLISEPQSWDGTVEIDDVCFKRWFFFPSDQCAQLDYHGRVTPTVRTSSDGKSEVLELLSEMDATLRIPIPETIAHTRPEVFSGPGGDTFAELLGKSKKYETIERHAHETKQVRVNEAGKIEPQTVRNPEATDSGYLLDVDASLGEITTRGEMLKTRGTASFDLNIEKAKLTVGAAPTEAVPFVAALIGAFTITTNVGVGETRTYDLTAKKVRYGPE